MASTVSKASATSLSITSLTAAPSQASLKPGKPVVWVDTREAMAEALDKIIDLPDNPPSLYIDLEGVKLSRDGMISIMQLFVAPLETTYLFDIYTMQSTAFTTCGRKNNRSLQDVLESEATPKVFFDVRNDSDALFSHYGIRLQGVADLQLMELAARSYGSRRFVNGLAKCIERDLGLSPAEKRAWADGKERGLTLFHPDRGGNYEVFNQRPLAQELKDYCVADVRFLPRLWTVYDGTIPEFWRPRVYSATKARIRESQSVTYNPHGPGRARARPTLEYY